MLFKRVRKISDFINIRNLSTYFWPIDKYGLFCNLKYLNLRMLTLPPPPIHCLPISCLSLLNLLISLNVTNWMIYYFHSNVTQHYHHDIHNTFQRIPFKLLIFPSSGHFLPLKIPYLGIFYATFFTGPT